MLHMYAARASGLPRVAPVSTVSACQVTDTQAGGALAPIFTSRSRSLINKGLVVGLSGRKTHSPVLAGSRRVTNVRFSPDVQQSRQTVPHPERAFPSCRCNGRYWLTNERAALSDRTTSHWRRLCPLGCRPSPFVGSRFGRPPLVCAATVARIVGKVAPRPMVATSLCRACAVRNT